MNWTGGRLRRHSKTNRTTSVNLQKNHLARARLQFIHLPHHPSPLYKSASAALNQPAGCRTIRTFAVERNDSYETDTSQCEEYDHLRNAPNGHGSTRSANQSFNTFSYIKRSLLERPDWLGLSIAKPLNIQFTPPKERARIARHRDLHRRARNSDVSSSQPCVSTVPDAHSKSSIGDRRPEIMPEDSLGIHETCFTAQQQTRLEDGGFRYQHRPSSWSQVDNSRNKSNSSARVTTLNPHGHILLEVGEENADAPEQLLPTLDNLRCYDTFDQIKIRAPARTVCSHRLPNDSDICVQEPLISSSAGPTVSRNSQPDVEPVLRESTANTCLAHGRACQKRPNECWNTIPQEDTSKAGPAFDFELSPWCLINSDMQVDHQTNGQKTILQGQDNKVLEHNVDYQDDCTEAYNNTVLDRYISSSNQLKPSSANIVQHLPSTLVTSKQQAASPSPSPSTRLTGFAFNEINAQAQVFKGHKCTGYESDQYPVPGSIAPESISLPSSPPYSTMTNVMRTPCFVSNTLWTTASSHSETLHQKQLPVSVQDDSEAWMRYTFGGDFAQMQQDFFRSYNIRSPLSNRHMTTTPITGTCATDLTLWLNSIAPSPDQSLGSPNYHRSPNAWLKNHNKPFGKRKLEDTEQGSQSQPASHRRRLLSYCTDFTRSHDLQQYSL